MVKLWREVKVIKVGTVVGNEKNGRSGRSQILIYDADRGDRGLFTI